MPALGYLVFTANKTFATALSKLVRGSNTQRLILAFPLESLRIRAIPRLKLILRHHDAVPAFLSLLMERCRDVFLICINSTSWALAHYKSTN